MTLVERSRTLPTGERATWTEETLPGGIVRRVSTSGHGLGPGAEYRFSGSVVLLEPGTRSQRRVTATRSSSPSRTATTPSSAAPRVEFTDAAHKELSTDLGHWDGFERAGVLVGEDLGSRIVVRAVGGLPFTSNVLRATHFMDMPVDDFAAFARQFERFGWRTVGVWHTHSPGGSLELSPADLNAFENHRQDLGLDRYLAIVLGTSETARNFTSPACRTTAAYVIDKHNTVRNATHDF